MTRIESGDTSAAEQLLPLIDDELRRLTTARLSREKPGQTLQATALVHEAYLRLIDVKRAQRWKSREHCFAAAAEAMRRILVERARSKLRLMRGGHLQQQDLEDLELIADERIEEALRVDAALDQFAEQDRQAADLVQLRFFVGLSIAEVAEALGISARTANRLWVYAKAWLHEELRDGWGWAGRPAVFLTAARRKPGSDVAHRRRSVSRSALIS